MKTMYQLLVLILLALFTMVPLTGCGDDQGPAEEAGEEIDDTVDDIEDEFEDDEEFEDFEDEFEN